MKRFYVTLILEVEDQSEEDLEYNAQQNIKDDINDSCLYIHEIKETK